MKAPWQSQAVRLADEGGVGAARRAARRLARQLGLGEVVEEQAAIVAAEAGRNMVQHAGGGQLLVTPLAGGGALEILALDRGPGIPDVARALGDGYSTAGTAGQGLGAISRIASVFDLYSVLDQGTALLAQVGKRGPGAVSVGGVAVALPTETECGDAWAISQSPDGPVVLLADGLGHGGKAAEAAAVAVAAFHGHASLPVDQLLRALHDALRPTRGAAVVVARCSRERSRIQYAGIGNISGAVLSSLHVRKMVSLPGTAGHEARSIRTFEYDWPERSLLVMHSDGITSRWDLAGYPGLSGRHPSLVAGVLLRDFARGRDDAMAVVVRRPGS